MKLRETRVRVRGQVAERLEIEVTYDINPPKHKIIAHGPSSLAVKRRPAWQPGQTF